MRYIYNIIKWIALFIWQLPQNIVALVMIPFLGKMDLVCIKRNTWCLYSKKMSGSISLGNFIFLGSKSDTTVAHELGHVVDSHRLGWLYLFVIGIPSIVWAGFNIYKKLGVSYYSLYTERLANKHSHLHDVKYGNYNYWYLEFDKDYNLDSIS